jgi:adenylate kinase
VNEIVEQAVEEAEACTLFLDGYPRDRQEVECLEKMEREGKIRLAAVVVLHLTRETALQRISGRRKCLECGSSFNVHSNPPGESGTCDKCGGSLQQREDDRPEVVSRRLDVYEAETLPAIEIFQALRPESTLNVSAEGSPEAVLSEVADSLGDQED